MISVGILSVLELISMMKPINVNDYRAALYKRENLSFYSAEFTAADPFRGRKGYPICPPASNLDCLFWKDWNVKVVRRCPAGKLWIGIGDETIDMAKFDVMEGDKVAIRGVQSDIPESWIRKDCTINGEFGTPICEEKGDFIASRKTQVVLLRKAWHAVRTVGILIGEEPYLHTCWQERRVVPVCNSSSAERCDCLPYPLGTIFVQRKGHKIPVDGVGVRTIHIAQNKPDPNTGICDLIKRDDEWFIEADRNLNEFQMISRKGAHEMVCEADEVGHICYSNGWKSFSGVLKVSLYREGLLYATCSADDDEDDFCKTVSIFKRWRHYYCWTMLEHCMLAVAVIIFLLCSSLMIIACCLCWAQLYRVLWWCCLPCRCFSRSVRKRRVIKEDLVKLLEEGDLGEERPVRLKRGNGLSLKKAALGLLLASKFKDTNAQCTSLDFLGFKTTCNNLDCAVSGKASVMLPSRDGVACFEVRDSDKILDLSYEFHIDRVYRKCIPFDSYWTADYHPKACSEFHCPSTCWDITPDNKWEFLRGCGVNQNSYIVKQTHQGCAGVGCVRCDDACVLYTKFFVMDKGTRPVQIVKCLDWVPQMKGKLVKKVGLNSSSADFTISTLQTVELLGTKFQWNFETSQYNFMQSESFLLESGRVCVLHANRKGSPVKGQVGFVQCAKENMTFDPSNCLRTEDDIECVVGNKAEVYCTHQSPSWERLCHKNWLPLERSGMYLTIIDDMPAISAHDFGLSQVFIEPVEGEIARFVEPKSSCRILGGEVTGCYSCDEGAKLSLKSQPINGAPVVRVSCEDSIGNFKFICGEEIIKVFATKSDIDTKCIGAWGHKTAAFFIKGTLIANIDIPMIGVNGTMNHVIDRSWQMPSWNAFKVHILVGSMSFLFIFIFSFCLFFRCR